MKKINKELALLVIAIIIASIAFAICRIIPSNNNSSTNSSSSISIIDNDMEKLTEAINRLNIPSFTSENLVLPNYDINGVVFFWISTDITIMLDNGIINRAYKDKDVVLKLTASIGGKTQLKDFNVKVLKLTIAPTLIIYDVSIIDNIVTLNAQTDYEDANIYYYVGIAYEEISLEIIKSGTNSIEYGNAIGELKDEIDISDYNYNTYVVYIYAENEYGSSSIFKKEFEIRPSPEITNVDDLKNLIDGEDYFLTNDIDLIEEENFSLGSWHGSINGKGYSISNLNITSNAAEKIGFINFSTGDIKLKNITFDNFTITADRANTQGGVAAILGRLESNHNFIAENVHIKNAKINSTSPNSNYFGGFVGRHESTGNISINKSSVDANIFAAKYSSLFVGGSSKNEDLIKGSIYINNVAAYGSIENSRGDTSTGGVISSVYSKVTIKNLLFAANVHNGTGAEVGGILGKINVGGSIDIIENVVFTGNITSANTETLTLNLIHAFEDVEESLIVNCFVIDSTTKNINLQGATEITKDDLTEDWWNNVSGFDLSVWEFEDNNIRLIRYKNVNT